MLRSFPAFSKFQYSIVKRARAFLGSYHINKWRKVTSHRRWHCTPHPRWGRVQLSLSLNLIQTSFTVSVVNPSIPRFFESLSNSFFLLWDMIDESFKRGWYLSWSLIGVSSICFPGFWSSSTTSRLETVCDRVSVAPPTRRWKWRRLASPLPQPPPPGYPERDVQPLT